MDGIEWKEYLLSFRNPTKRPTHTSIRGGSFHVPKSKRPAFYKKYLSHIHSGGKASLTERFLKNDDGIYLPAPVCIDFDFRYNEEVQERLHSPEMVEKLCDLFFCELHKLMEIPQDKYNIVVVQHKPGVKHDPEKKLVKDGIHFIFPNIVCCPEVQILLRKNALANVEAILSPLPLTNKMSDVYDLNVTKFTSGWMLQHSAKPNCETYKTDIIFKYNDDTLSVDNRKLTISDLSIHTTMPESIYRQNTKLYIVKEQEKEELKMKKIKESKMVMPTKGELKDQLELVQKLIAILNEQRAHDYDSWLHVGFCLYNIDKINNLQVWKKFSARAGDLYNEESCNKKWSGFKDFTNGPTMGSLRYWAEEDNLDEAKKVINGSKMMKDIILKSLGGTHHDVAEVIKKRSLENYKATNKMWFFFNGQRWQETNDAMKLRQFISKEIRDLYTDWQKNFSDMASQQDDETLQELWGKRATKCSNIFSKLGDASFKDKVIKESKELFHDQEFLDNLDSDKSIMGFENGVYDLKKKEFRDGLPNDNLSMTTGYDFIDDFTESDDLVKNVRGFINQVLPVKQVREYAMRVMASCLSGENRDESFNLWTGSGGNGKSKIIDLISLALGDYACELPVAYLTQTRQQSGNASPHIMKTKGRRFCFMQEPNEEDKINVGLMKEMTGNDTIQARALYQEPVKFKPQFKIVLMCNKLPKIPSDDKGTWRRLKVTEFISTFKDKPDPTEKYEFPINRQLADDFELWKSVFMWILVEKYKVYDKEGNPEPREVVKYTESYQAREDIIAKYLKDNVIVDMKVEPITTLKIFNRFKVWMKEEGFEGKEIPKCSAIREKLESEKKYMNARVPNTNKYYIRFSVENGEALSPTSITDFAP